jgi:hypothetical protein
MMNWRQNFLRRELLLKPNIKSCINHYTPRYRTGLYSALRMRVGRALSLSLSHTHFMLLVVHSFFGEQVVKNEERIRRIFFFVALCPYNLLLRPTARPL